MNPPHFNAPDALPRLGERLRFVVLHHTGVPPHPAAPPQAAPASGDHFDLLLEVPGRERLLTWRILQPPHTWATQPPTAQRLPDHRRLYLTYEGPLSGNRGTVRQVLSGLALVLQTTPILQLQLNAGPTLTLALASAPAGT